MGIIGRLIFETDVLTGDSLCYGIFYSRYFWLVCSEEIGLLNWFDGKMKVKTIKNRTRKFLLIGGNLDRRTSTFVGRIAEVTARTGVRETHQERGRQDGREIFRQA